MAGRTTDKYSVHEYYIKSISSFDNEYVNYNSLYLSLFQNKKEINTGILEKNVNTEMSDFKFLTLENFLS